MGECLAARDGLNLAVQQRLDRVILECDNLSLINMVRVGNGDRSEVMVSGKRSKSWAGLL